MNMSDTCLQDWQNFKKSQFKVSNIFILLRPQWMIIKNEVVDDEASPLVTEATGGKDSTHAQLWDTISKTEPRIVVYKLHYQVKRNEETLVPKTKILVIRWVPPGLSGMKGVKLQMLATSATAAVKASFNLETVVQATAEDEFELTAFVDKAKKFERDEVVAGSWA
jgi:hypothetical protein